MTETTAMRVNTRCGRNPHAKCRGECDQDFCVSHCSFLSSLKTIHSIAGIDKHLDVTVLFLINGFCNSEYLRFVLLQTVTISLFKSTTSRAQISNMSETDHILVVDDDLEIRHLLKHYLEKNGYRVTAVGDGKAMWKTLNVSRIELVILDIMLPGDDGLTLCRNLRARSEIPIIMLTARGEDTDRIVGLEIGADDYLPKPFNPRELLARIKVVLRRARSVYSEETIEGAARVHFADWTLDINARHLIAPDSVVIPLSGGEYRLLRVLLDHPNRVLNRDQILDLSRGKEWEPFDRSIDVQVSRLRRRLRDDGKNPAIIKTVRGEGYVLATKVTVEQ